MGAILTKAILQEHGCNEFSHLAQERPEMLSFTLHCTLSRSCPMKCELSFPRSTDLLQKTAECENLCRPIYNLTAITY
jgi:hypothetical protein